MTSEEQVNCFCGKPGLISRERFYEGAWVCIEHAMRDAAVDACHLTPLLTGFRMTEYFIKKYGYPRPIQEPIQ